ncbi:hypothetical protein IDH44_10255 [Paenibacillus sp. IB182496]|uniref:Uncharacterized protein n=1 Tax=Paenibacillus sabuli TaxID=2772509 RepID=A0A927BSP0_9BACL|nr:hypothetical protein [Paenibacillus sabuli]MBD2845572.1 hypothetical protein [Paenibacillus sabuli]
MNDTRMDMYNRLIEREDQLHARLEALEQSQELVYDEAYRRGSVHGRAMLLETLQALHKMESERRQMLLRVKLARALLAHEMHRQQDEQAEQTGEQAGSGEPGSR